MRLGGLIAYGTDFAELFGLAAEYIDRLLKVAKPGGAADPAADQIRVGDQSQYREGARVDHSRMGPFARRQGDRTVVLCCTAYVRFWG